MTAMGEWAMGLCAAGVACAVFDMLSPGGGLRRVSGVLTAVFFFCCLIGPLGEVIGECRQWFSSETASSMPIDTTLDDTALRQVEEMLAASLAADAAASAEPYGVSVQKVVPERDISRPDSIYIERIRVVFAKDDAPVSAALIKELERAWGRPVEVYYTDEQ